MDTDKLKLDVNQAIRTVRAAIKDVQTNTSLYGVVLEGIPVEYAPHEEVDTCLYLNQTSDIAYSWIYANDTKIAIRSMIAGKAYGTMEWIY